MSDSTTPQLGDERWSIVTDEGLLMWRADLFTRDEARAHVAANPTTASGEPQYAVPASVARRSMELYVSLGDEYTRRLATARRSALCELLDEAGVQT